ncbi:MAG: BON domain-containing protein [Candidatus Lokiarchaeota archaeon]|nr:BON domain-containing protein [Candidatus Lokiarchaeota archaeon]
MKSKKDKEKLEDIINEIYGIRKIKNRLAVLKGGYDEDKKVAQGVIEGLKNEPRVDIDDVNFQVEDKVITLYGTVPHKAARDGAECAAKSSEGVLKVKNNLKMILKYSEIL